MAGKKARAGISPKKRFLKIAAVAVVAIFIIIIAAGLVKEFFFSSLSHRVSQTEASEAKAIVASALQAEGDNISNYSFSTGHKSVTRYYNGRTVTVLQAILQNGTTTHLYLIDISAGKILAHSKTDFYVNGAERSDASEFCEELEPYHIWCGGMKK
jgi:uncharacterized protein (UPF0333 family)